MGTVSIEKENLQKAFAEGCSDVKKVLRNLFPGQCEKEKEWVNIGKDVTVTLDPGSLGRYFIHLWHKGSKVAYVSEDPDGRNNGVRACEGFRVTPDMDTYIIERFM